VLVANALQKLAGATDNIVADTLPRGEIALPRASADEELRASPEEPGISFAAVRGAGVTPILAAVGALLLALELWGFRRGWSA
jgi:hypothetical protein